MNKEILCLWKCTSVQETFYFFYKPIIILCPNQTVVRGLKELLTKCPKALNAISPPISSPIAIKAIPRTAIPVKK
jgi:hypothetical protein